MTPGARDKADAETKRIAYDVRDRVGAQEAWRVGKQVSLNVYDGDRPVCQCHNAEDAARIVAAVNAMHFTCGPPVEVVE